VLVAHTCNLSYSGDREQEDHSLKPAQAKCEKPYLKENHDKRKGCWSGSRCRLRVQTLVPQRKKKKKNKPVLQKILRNLTHRGKQTNKQTEKPATMKTWEK
jgi:hypothetical protein